MQTSRRRQPALLVVIAALTTGLISVSLVHAAAPGGDQQLINLDVKDAPIEQVLRMLAKAANVNIVIGQDVRGTVEAISLRDVTVDQALRLIAKSHGFFWYKEDNVYVVSKEPQATTSTPVAPGGAPTATTTPGGGPAQPASAGEAGGPLTNGGPRTQSAAASTMPPLVPATDIGSSNGPRLGEPRIMTTMLPLSFADAGQIAMMFGGTSCDGGSAQQAFASAIPSYQRHKAQRGLSRGNNGLNGADFLSGGYATPRAAGNGSDLGWNQGGFGGGRGGAGGGFGGQQTGGFGGQQTGGVGGRQGGLGGQQGGGGGALGSMLPGDMQPPIAFLPENALLVQGTQEDIDKFREILEMLDKPAKQVEIATKFIEVQTTESEALGIDWSLSNGSLEFFNQGFAPGEAINSVVRFARGRFESQLNAMLSSGRATLVNEPRVIAMNNQYAEINFSTTIPYFTATITYNNFGQRSVDFTEEEVDVENSLWVVPRINADDSVTVYLEPELDDQIGTVTGPNGETVPIVTTQYVSTTVRVGDGETIVLGGLVRKSENRNLKETPLLSRIPIIGKLFSSKSTSKNNSELLIFVTPRIVRDVPPQ